MSESLSRQIISVGAATCQQFLSLIIMASLMRQEARDASATASEMQSEATRADGYAQQAALQKEAGTRGNMAQQSFFEGLSQLGGEAGGFFLETGLSYKPSATKARETVAALQAWDNKLAKLELGQGNVVNVSKTVGQPKPIPVVTPEQVASIDPVILHKQNAQGEIITPEEYFKNNPEKEAAFQSAAESRDATYLKFKKELRRQLKDARSESEKTSSSAQQAGTRLRDVLRQGDAAARWQYNLSSQKLQLSEADEKLDEANARYSADVESSTVRIAQGTADNQSSLIQAIQQAKGEIDSSNNRG